LHLRRAKRARINLKFARVRREEELIIQRLSLTRSSVSLSFGRVNASGTGSEVLEEAGARISQTTLKVHDALFTEKHLINIQRGHASDSY
jgi:hypothetical protein